MLQGARDASSSPRLRLRWLLLEGSPAEYAFLSKTKDVAERQLGRNDVVHQDAFQVEEDDDFSDDSDSDSERQKAF